MTRTPRTHAPCDATFARQLEPFRRRLQWVSQCRRLLVVAPAGIVAVEFFMLLGPRLPSAPPWLPAVIGGMVLLLLLLVTSRRTTLHTAAAALDRRTRHDDCMVSALQFAADESPAARLIGCEASVRLAALAPAQTFPLEAPPWGRATVAVVSVATALCLLDGTATPTPWAHGREGWLISGGPTPQAPTVLEEASRATGQPASAQVVSGAMVDARADPGTAVEARSADAVDQRSAKDGPQPSALADHTKGASVGHAAMPSAPTRQPGLAPAMAPQAAGTIAAGARTPGASAGGGDGAGGLGGESAFATLDGQGAGGVRHGSLVTEGRAEMRASGPRSPAYAARYLAARQLAESAIAQERVPARYRVHVRQYFASIRPTGSR